MRFHVITGDTTSTDFETHIAIRTTYDVKDYSELLVELVEFRCFEYWTFEDPDYHERWSKKKFVQMILAEGEHPQDNCVGDLCELAKNIDNEKDHQSHGV